MPLAGARLRAFLKSQCLPETPCHPTRAAEDWGRRSGGGATTAPVGTAGTQSMADAASTDSSAKRGSQLIRSMLRVPPEPKIEKQQPHLKPAARISFGTICHEGQAGNALTRYPAEDARGVPNNSHCLDLPMVRSC